MISHFRAGFSVFLMLLCTAAGALAPEVGHVFIVSFDGARPDAMQSSKMPELSAMVAEGAACWNAQTVFPSVTLIAHTSMLTGVGPEKHRVDWNDWVPEKGLVTVPTVFSIAKQRGFSTAMFVGKEKFKHLNLPDTVDSFEFPDYSETVVAQTAARYITDKKPQLCFIHFADPDGTGHKYGWCSPEQKSALAEGDTALGAVRRAIETAGIAGDSVIIVTADHGGHDKTHGSHAREDMTIPWIVWGKGVKKGFTITAPVTTFDTAATALWLMHVAVPEEWDGRPVTTAFAEP